MKKITFIGLIILCQMLLFCHTKTEKVQKKPEIYFNNQNFKYDDDEILKREQENNKSKVKANKTYQVNAEK